MSPRHTPGIVMSGGPDISTSQAKDTQTISLVDDLLREALSKLDEYIDGEISLVDSWIRSQRRMLGDHWDHDPKHDEEHVVLNYVATAIIAITSVQTETDLRPEFTAVESDDEPIWYLSERAGLILVDLEDEGLIDLDSLFADQEPPEVSPIPPGKEGDIAEKERFRVASQEAAEAFEDLKTKQLAGEHPISHAQVKVLQKLTEPWPALITDPMTGQKIEVMQDPAIESDDLIAVTDALAAGEFQRVHDALFEAARGSFYFKQNEYQNNIFGHQAMLFEFTDDWQFKFWNPNVLNVLIDPLASCIEEARYLIYDELIDADQAKIQFPDAKEDIDRTASDARNSMVMGSRRGNWHGNSMGSDSYISGRGYGGVDIQRPMLTVRTTWIRNGASYAMSPQQAIDRGQVMFIHEPGKYEGVEVESVDEPGYYLIERDPQTHEIVGLMPVSQDDKQWPSALGIRQIKTLVEADRVVDDGECAYSDFPAAWNVNIPIPFSPYGMGEPIRLEKLSQIINRLASILATVVRHYQYPQLLFPASVYQALKDAGVDTFARIGQAWAIDDGLYDEYVGKDGTKRFQMDPPSIPQGYFELLPEMIRIFEQLSNHNQALQGNAPTADASGRAIEALVSSARGAIAFKAERTQDALERMGRITAHAIQTMMPSDIWRKYASSYGPAVVEAIREKVKSLRFDVSVSVTGGKGASKRIKGEQARSDHQAGLIDDRTALEETGRDADKIIKRKAEQSKREQELLAPPPPPPAAISPVPPSSPMAAGGGGVGLAGVGGGSGGGGASGGPDAIANQQAGAA